MIDLRKGFERRSVVLLIAVPAGSSTNAVHPRAPVFHPRLPVRDRFTPSVETANHARDGIATRAPTRAAICCGCAHRRRLRRLDDTSPDVKFVSATTGICASEALSGGLAPVPLRDTAPASSGSSA